MSPSRRYEILQRFIEGVRDAALRRELSVIYAFETTVTDPPTVESLRFTTRQLQRTRAKSAQIYDPRYAMRSRPHPYVPLPPNKLVVPQGVLPPPPANNAPVNQAAASPAARLPLGACFIVVKQVSLLETALPEITLVSLQVPAEPEAVNVTAKDVTEGLVESYSGIRQFTFCGAFDHVDSHCAEIFSNHGDEFAYNRWAEVEAAGVAAHTVPLEDDRVLMLHPAEPPVFHTLLTITCGAKQVQTYLEPTTFDPHGRMLISIHLMLAAEQLHRHTLTVAKLWVELSFLYKRVELPLPKEWYPLETRIP